MESVTFSYAGRRRPGAPFFVFCSTHCVLPDTGFPFELPLTRSKSTFLERRFTCDCSGDCASSGGDQVKNFKSSISTSMERAAIKVAPRGRAATKVVAALLILELALRTIGCTKSKPFAQNSQENKILATAPPAAVPAALPDAVNQAETPKKNSVQGPVRKLPRTLLYTDAD